jgi:hypothetical protein
MHLIVDGGFGSGRSFGWFSGVGVGEDGSLNTGSSKVQVQAGSSTMKRNGDFLAVPENGAAATTARRTDIRTYVRTYYEVFAPRKGQKTLPRSRGYMQSGYAPFVASSGLTHFLMG